MKAKLICAWCGRLIRWIETTNGRNSHGICRSCYEKQIGKLNEKDHAMGKPIQAPPAGE